MGKEKKQEIEERGYKDWYKLIYFRWKALIRSKEYLKFYDEEVKKLFDKKIEHNKLQEDFSKNHSIDYFLEKIITGTDPIKPLSLSENTYKEPSESEIAEKYLESYPFFSEEVALMEKAKQRFNLIVYWVTALMPIDIQKSPAKDMIPWITFKEYLPYMPDDNQQKNQFVKVFGIEEIKSGVAVHFDAFPTKRLFLIETDMPFELIVNDLKNKLGYYDEKKRAGRKQFEDWEEYFKIWDTFQYVKDTYKRRDVLLETARLMEKETRLAEWQNTNKEYIKNRVSRAVKEAQRLINLAERGQFVAL